MTGHPGRTAGVQGLGSVDDRLVVAVRRYYDCVDSNDVDGVVALFTDDAVYHRPGYEPLVGRRRLERFYREERVIQRGEHRLAAVVVHGPAVAVHGEFSGTLRDGRELTLRFADFFLATETGSFRRRDTFFFTPLV
jgi:steroid delta-isomerase